MPGGKNCPTSKRSGHPKIRGSSSELGGERRELGRFPGPDSKGKEG